MSGLLGSALGAQLVKAGLATEDQLEKSQQAKKERKKPAHHKKAKPAGKGKNPRRGGKTSGKANRDQAARKADTSKVEVSESIVTRQVSKKAKVNELIRKHVVADAAADQEFNFAINGKLRQITVTQQQADLISKGELAIVKTDVSRDPYALIPAAAAIELRELQPGRIAAFFDDEDTEDENLQAKPSDNEGNDTDASAKP